MKLTVIQCVNGNFSIVAEGLTSEQAALVNFHNRCTLLWNAADVLTGEVAIFDEQLDVYHGCKELIRHEPQPEPEENGVAENNTNGE